MGESKIAVQLGIANFCPVCGVKFARPQPEEGEQFFYCPEDDGGCGAKLTIRKLGA